MADTLTPEKWGRKESADWWSAGQAARQQLYGAATEMMLDLAGVQAGSRVLDVAAGTGESTLMAAARVGPKSHVLAADVSATMLTVAAEAARKAGLTNVETRVMNAENLEIDTDSFDAVICRIALMLFPNPAKALAEMRRVVKPGGKVAVMVYAALEKNPFWGIFHKTVRRLGNVPPPLPAEPWMFALGEPGALEEVYTRADFLNVSVRAIPIQRRLPSAAAAVENMRKGAGDRRELMNRLNEADRERAWAEIAEQFKRFEGPNGFEIPGEVLVGVGSKLETERVEGGVDDNDPTGPNFASAEYAEQWRRGKKLRGEASGEVTKMMLAGKKGISPIIELSEPFGIGLRHAPYRSHRSRWCDFPRTQSR